MFLKALTEEARQGLGGDYLTICTFPFRVGRERRSEHGLGNWTDVELRGHGSAPLCELYLVDPDEPLNLSFPHFAIRRIDGIFSIEDLGSKTGLIIEGYSVGKNRAIPRSEIHHLDVIIVGPSWSPFIFKFLVH